MKVKKTTGLIAFCQYNSGFKDLTDKIWLIPMIRCYIRPDAHDLKFNPSSVIRRPLGLIHLERLIAHDH